MFIVKDFTAMSLACWGLVLLLRSTCIILQTFPACFELRFHDMGKLNSSDIPLFQHRTGSITKEMYILNGKIRQNSPLCDSSWHFRNITVSVSKTFKITYNQDWAILLCKGSSVSRFTTTKHCPLPHPTLTL